MEEIFVILFCLGANAVLASIEMAFVSVSRAELRILAKSGRKEAQTILQLREHPERTLSMIQIGITLVGALAAAVGGAGAADTLEPYFAARLNISSSSAEALSLAVIVIPMTFLSVVIGELVPKSLALRSPIKIALASARFLVVADKIFYPLISGLEKSTRWILKSFFAHHQSGSQEEVKTVELTDLSPHHQETILNLANIEKRQIRDIMVPIDQVTFVDVLAEIEHVAQVALSSGHTRLPVRRGNFFSGVLHTKEFFSLKESGETQWQSLIRPPLFVTVQDSALATLRLMQAERIHMALVTNPPPQVVGIVTLEDIIEEVVGDIFDEDDDGRVRKIYARKQNIRKMRG